MLFRGYPPEARLLLGTQLVFNLGFYAVVPFLAGAMSGEFGLGAAAIGLVLGARTFSQQGMFLLGGMLADRWGARRSILTGCLVRISGYAILAAASGFPLFLLGAVLTGVGGALFSPALEAQLSRADHFPGGQSPAPRPDRRSVFVWLAITGEIGAVLGPVLGSTLLGWGLDAALLGGITVFSAVTALHWWRLPQHHTQHPRNRPANTPGPRHRRLPDCLRNRRFVTFCALGSVNLLAYNQLYFAVPVELERRGLDPAWLGGLFLLASVLTLTLQLPVAGLTGRLGPRRTLAAGFTLLGIAFAVLAVSAVQPAAAAKATETLVPLAASVAVLILGRMMLSPTLLALVPTFVPSGGTGRGAYFGLLSTCGGIAVLTGNTVLGGILDLTDRHGWWPGTPWIPLILLACLSAAALPQTLHSDRTKPRTESATNTAIADRTT